MRWVWWALLPLAVSCGGVAVPRHAPGAWTPPEVAQLAALRLTSTAVVDPSNRWSSDPAAAALGERLFFDPALSGNGAVSCATCHDPAKHFTDGQPLGTGVGTTARHTPTIVGSQSGPWFFWDGRADSLWSQALGPMEAPTEMGGDRVAIVRYVSQAYGDAWTSVVGDAGDLSGLVLPTHARPGATGAAAPAARTWEALTPEVQHRVNTAFASVGKVIAAYEATLVPLDAPFDHYVDAVVAGDMTGGGALTAQQVRGLDLFVGTAACTLCHSGPLFTDRAFHNNGVPETRPGYDPGRREGGPLVLGSPFNCAGPFSDTDVCPELTYLDPSFPDFQAAFKTPTLRYVSETAPYQHNGSMATLREVLDFYSELASEPPVGHRELTLRPLHLSNDDKAAIIAFLGSLTERRSR